MWFVRQRQLLPDRVRTRGVLQFTEPVEICADRHSGASPIYEGLVGDRHLKAICSRHSLYMDISHVPVSSLTISGLGRMQPPQPSLSSTERRVKKEPDESSSLMDLKLPFHSVDSKKDVSCEKIAPWREVPAPGGPGATRLKPKASHYSPCKYRLTQMRTYTRLTAFTTYYYLPLSKFRRPASQRADSAENTARVLLSWAR